jgi:hypothetical protein
MGANIRNLLTPGLDIEGEKEGSRSKRYSTLAHAEGGEPLVADMFDLPFTRSV